MMFLQGFIYIIFGIVFVYIGSLNIICSTLSKDDGKVLAEKLGHIHGEWIMDKFRKDTTNDKD